MSANNVFHIVNRTTHTINIIDTGGNPVSYKSEGIAFRVASLSEEIGKIKVLDRNGNIREVQVFEAGFGDTIVVMYNRFDDCWQVRSEMIIPEIQRNTIYVVSANVKACNPNRPDFFAPGSGVFEQAHSDSGQTRSMKIAAIGLNGVFK